MHYFRTLAQIEHFTKAAEQLHITQPSLSKSIANLERELGSSLFDRMGKQIRLNAVGQAFLSRVNQILGDLDESREMVADMSKGLQGALRIGTSFPITAPSPIREYLYLFFGDYPQISQHIYVLSVERIEAMLLDRELDFGFTLAPPHSMGIDWYRLYSEELGVVVGPGHPLSSMPSARLEDLSGERFLCNSSAPDPRDTARFLCGLAGFKPNIIYEGGDAEFIGEAVSAGYGISFVSKARYHMFHNDQNRAEWERTLHFLPLENNFCYRPVFICYLTGHYRTRIGRTFYDGLLPYCSASPGFGGIPPYPNK